MTNLGHEGKHPASRLKLRVWMDQEVIFSLPVPRNGTHEPGYVWLAGPRSAHDGRQLHVRCAIIGPEQRVRLWVGQFTLGRTLYYTDFLVVLTGYGENTRLATDRDLAGTSVRVTCSP